MWQASGASLITTHGLASKPMPSMIIASGPYATELNASKDRAATHRWPLRCSLSPSPCRRAGEQRVWGRDRTSSATFLTNRWVPNGAVEPAHRQA